MADRTMTAMYDTRGAAESARDDLVALGIPSANVTIRGTESGASTSSTSSTTEDKGFLDSLQGYRIWSRTSFQRVVIGSGPAVQRWEGRLKGHIKLGHAYQEANLTRASSRER